MKNQTKVKGIRAFFRIFSSLSVAGFAAALFIFFIGWFAPVSAQSPGPIKPAPVKIVRSPDQPSGGGLKASGFVWTEEEMRRAIPVPTENNLQDLTNLPMGIPDGPPGWAPSFPPKGLNLPALTSGKNLFPSLDGTYENPNDYSLFPFRATGKVFFTDGVTPHLCSAAVIGDYAVWTAGHCVHPGNGDPNKWYTNWIFIPAFKNLGAENYGVWIASYMYTTNQWFEHADARYDFAVAIVSSPQPQYSGMKIKDVVGSLGFAYNQPLQQPRLAIGYPTNFQGGFRQIITEASTAFTDTAFTPPAPVGITSTMRAGASGGPWMINFSIGEVGGANLLNGSFSYFASTGEDRTYSPYFGDDAKALYDCAIQSTPDRKTCGNEADLVLTQAASSLLVLTGDPLTYTLAIYNQGSLTATNVIITDVLPLAVSLRDAGLPGGSCGAADAGGGGNTVVTCTLGMLPRWTSITATLAVTMPLQVGEVTNIASVISDQPDKTPLDNLNRQVTVMVLDPYRSFFPFIAH